MYDYKNLLFKRMCHFKTEPQFKTTKLMAYQNCQICFLVLLLLSCTIQSKKYLREEHEMAQEFATSENEIFEINRPLFFFEDQKNSNMKRSGSGNIRLLRKKSNQPKVGIRLLQI